MNKSIEIKQLIPSVTETMSYAEFIQGFLANLDHVLGNLSNELSHISGGRVLGRQLQILCDYLDLKYRDGGSEKTEKELLIEYKMCALPVSFERLLKKYVWTNFEQGVSIFDDFGRIHSRLSGTIHAINKKEIERLVFREGQKSERTLSFIEDMYHFSHFDVYYRTFKDSQIETIYSNDNIRISDSVFKSFFDFFSEGESSYKETVYDASKYYGSIPVSENRIRSFFKGRIIGEKLDKLMDYVKVSDRFDVYEDEDGVLKYNLKIQYLKDIYAEAVAILYANGKPMLREDIFKSVVDLNKRYPNLVEKPQLSSFVIRRKPILSAAGQQGSWTLKIWGERSEHVFEAIRRIVKEEYEKTGKPVMAEVVMTELKSQNHDYPLKTVRTYITKANCKSVTGGYIPEDAPEKGRVRKDGYKIQRLAAESILEKRRSLSYSELLLYIKEKGHTIEKESLRRFIEQRGDVFVRTKREYVIYVALSEKIKSKRDIKEVFPDPKPREPEYVTNVRREIINYVYDKRDKTQLNLVQLFVPLLPARLKSPDAIIRKIFNEDDIFMKRREGNDRIINLTDSYRERIELQKKPTFTPKEQFASRIVYSWPELKKNILVKYSGDLLFGGQSLSEKDIESMYLIMGRGEELQPNSSFVQVLEQLFVYLTDTTDYYKRDLLRKDLLNSLELYMRNCYYLLFGTDYTSSTGKDKGLGQIRYELQNKRILPDPESRLLSLNERTISKIVENLNTARNALDHPKNTTNYSEKRIAQNIHDCVILQLYLAQILANRSK